MFKLKNSFTGVCMIAFACQAMAQQNNDKVLFTPEAFVEQIKFFHPVVKQADIQVDKASAAILSAKGLFDPVTDISSSRKTFDGKNYYNYFNPELKIPTPFAVNIKSGLENNGGSLLNPEITPGKTSYIGVEMPLAKGLLIDNRRATLQQARLFRRQTEQERLALINDLLFNAYISYWQWAGAFMVNNVYTKFMTVAHDRLRLVRIAFNNGDRAAMDTTEAFAQLQSYQLQQSAAQLELNNAKFELSNYLWLEGDSPYLLADNLVPDTLQFETTLLQQEFSDMLQQSKMNNPLIRTYDFKLNGLEVEKKLKFQSLLPLINLSANLLNKNYYVLKGLDAATLQNNYKWGLEVKIPLFMRQARGDYRQVQLKIKETTIELNRKRWEISNKIRTYYNENLLLQQQLQTARQIYNNYSALLRNENLKFAQGESSLFLVNSRETKVLEILQKQIELRVKYLKSLYGMQWAAGLLRW